MITSKRLLHIWWVWLAPTVGVATIAVALYFMLHAPANQHYRLTLSAGELGTTRSKLAETLRVKAATHGLTLEFRETAGSQDELEQVNAHTLDIAFVQGGVHIENAANVRQVASLQIEPLHFLVRKELAEKVANNWDALEGKTVNLGPAGSGTHLLALEVMEFVGLHPQQPGKQRGYVPRIMPHQELRAEQDGARLPDAIFLVASMPSETVKELVHTHDYRLVPLPFADAFALGGLNAAADKARHHEKKDCIDRARIYATFIPAFTYRVEPHVPEKALPSLGTRLLLVAHQDVDAQAVERLVEVIYDSQFASVTRPALDPKLLDLPPEFAWHKGSQLYKERGAPIVSGRFMDSAHRAMAILAALVSGLFVLYQWHRMRGGFKRDQGFKKYLQKVTWIEARATNLELDQPGALQVLIDLRFRLGRLRTEILDRFSAGELVGHELMQSFLILAADVRDGLTAMMRQCPQGEPTGEASGRHVAAQIGTENARAESTSYHAAE